MAPSLSVMNSTNSSSFFVIDVTPRERLFNRVVNWVRPQGQMCLTKPAQGNKFLATAVEKRLLLFFFFLTIMKSLLCKYMIINAIIIPPKLK